jgi:hypothetical protein
MKRLISFSLSVFCCICLVVATDRHAYAYVDPGSGLLALQSIAAAGAAFGYFMRRRIALLFGSGSEKDVTTKKPIAKVVLSAPVVQKGDTRNAA